MTFLFFYKFKSGGYPQWCTKASDYVPGNHFWRDSYAFAVSGVKHIPFNYLTLCTVSSPVCGSLLPTLCLEDDIMLGRIWIQISDLTPPLTLWQDIYVFLFYLLSIFTKYPYKKLLKQLLPVLTNYCRDKI